MEKRRQKASSLDYPTLCDLARSRNIRYVEARGLDTRKGVRFTKNGSDWIVVDSDLPVKEKIRTLGYLLENEPATVAANVGIKRGTEISSLMPVLTMCCS
ncbi:MAG: hypothetical protein ABSC04_05385 [Syntrophobacteraceae bacterium]